MSAGKILTVVLWEGAEASDLTANFAVYIHDSRDTSMVDMLLRRLEKCHAENISTLETSLPSRSNPLELVWENGSTASHECRNVGELKRMLNQVRNNGKVHPIRFGWPELTNAEKKAAKKGGKLPSSKKKCKKRCPCANCN